MRHRVTVIHETDLNYDYTTVTEGTAMIKISSKSFANQIKQYIDLKGMT